MTTATLIPALSNPAPSRADPANFDFRGASLLTDLPTLVDKINTASSELTSWNSSTDADKIATEASKTAAGASEQAAKTSALNSAQRSATWTSGVNYSLGYLVESPITARQYRCIQAGVSTTDPALDATRWQVLGFEFNTQYPNIKPTLNLNFAKTKILDPRITFTRNSIATYFDQYGVMKTAQANQARFDHDPVTGDSLGLLIEESRTNSLTYSEDFSNVVWSKNLTTVLSNQTVSPNGLTTSSKVVAQSGALNQHFITYSDITPGNCVRSVFMKAGELSHGTISAYYPTPGSYAGAVFNLSNGTVVTTTSGDSATIVHVGNNWYKCSLYTTKAGSTSFGGFQIRPSTGSTNISESYVGDGMSGIYIWGAQLESGAFPTSYIPTTTAQVTRAADSAGMTGTNFSSWYRQDEGTLFASGNWSYGSELRPGNRALAVLGAMGDWCLIYNESGNAGAAVVQKGGVTQMIQSTTPPSSDTVTAAIAMTRNNSGYSKNGGTPATDTTFEIPPVSYLGIGNSGPATGFLGGYIKKIAYYPKRLSNTELQALTA